MNCLLQPETVPQASIDMNKVLEVTDGEEPETVPQASIDMNKVLEVTDGEEVTGHAFSLAITAPDRVHFVKGTCREECRWWGDVLSVFPRSKKLTSFVDAFCRYWATSSASFSAGLISPMLYSNQLVTEPELQISLTEVAEDVKLTSFVDAFCRYWATSSASFSAGLISPMLYSNQLVTEPELQISLTEVAEDVVQYL
ncbi:hypothetical protein C0J52_25703 [Blattella germanica]|nr:hypothetical protein C0J52_25703 [Blattella germanica]